MNVSIMGAGALGTALGKILTDNGHVVSFYDPGLLDASIEEATADADAVVVAIPAEAIPGFCKDCPVRLKNLPIILSCKGLTDTDHFKAYKQLSVLYVAAFAQDIMAGNAVAFVATDDLARRLFANDQVKMEVSEDLRGVMLCGALKGVYAIGAGYQRQSESEMAIYLTRAHCEGRRYLAEHGADPETCELACGIGDLAMCCYSPSSRNFQCGRMLQEGRPLSEIKEKIGTIEGLVALDRVDRQGYPLIDEIHVLVEKASDV